MSAAALANRLSRLGAGVLPLIVPLTSVCAAPAAGAAEWNGEVSFGLVSTRGNTETETANLGLELENDRERWRHRGRAEALRATDEGEDTAERYLLGWQSNYKLGARDYVFVNGRAARDLFSGFEYQLSETVGYGREWIFTPSLRLEAQAGGGLRQSKTDDGAREEEGIVRGAALLRWTISKNAEFRQRVIIESGDSNTLTESVTSVTSKLVGNLGMSLKLNIIRNSQVPAGTKHTDRITSVNLVYSF